MPNPTPTSIDISERWQQFKAADYPQRVTLFQRTLNDGTYTEDMLGRMLEQLNVQVTDHNDHGRFSELVTAVRQKAAQVYEEQAGRLLYWQLSHTLAGGDEEQAQQILAQFVAQVETFYSMFLRALDMLAYHERTATIADLMERAWPSVRDSEAIFNNAADQFATQATDHIIFAYLEQTDVPDATNRELLARLQQFFAIDAAGLERYFVHLRGQVDNDWSLSDFLYEQETNGQGETAVSAKKASENWTALMVEFLGYLHREEGVSLSKGNLARHQFPHYFTARRTGQLDPKPDIGNLMRSGRPMPSPTPKPRHALCPDRDTLQEYISRLLHYARPQLYKAAVVYEMTPAWLRFLKRQNLITPDEHQELQRVLQEIEAEMRAFWQEHAHDSALRRSTAQWQ